MKRKDERQWIIKLIYQNDFNKVTRINLDELLQHNKIESEFVKESVLSIIDNIDQIDQVINRNLSNSDISSLPHIDRAILRVSVNEFVVQKSVPTSVSINEAVENAKVFSNVKSYKLINGILSAIAKDM